LKIGSLELEEIIIRSLESGNIESLESDKSGPYWVPNIFFKKIWLQWRYVDCKFRI